MGPAGPVKVIALRPGEGDILRIDGVLMGNGSPTSTILHASQLSLSFLTQPIQSEEPDDDGLQIGFVIFDELANRQKERDGTGANNSEDGAS